MSGLGAFKLLKFSQKPLDAVRRHFSAVVPATKPFGVSNDFLAARPGHPFFRQLLDALPAWNMRYGTNYPTVMFSTGPGFLDFQAMKYLARQHELPERDRLFIMSIHLYSHQWASYFEHHHGSTWHQKDAWWCGVHKDL